MTPAELRSPTFAESVAIDNYKEATKGALEGADGAGDKIAAAAVSAATAYGAVIALVAEKEAAQPLVMALPFVGFGIALVVALWGQSLGVNTDPTEAIDKVQSAVAGLIAKKRILNRAALLVLGAGVVAAGFLVADKYRRAAEPSETKAAVVVLTPSGRSSVAGACGSARSELRGRLDPAKLDDAWIRVEKPARCPRVRGSLALPAAAVTSVRLAP